MRHPKAASLFCLSLFLFFQCLICVGFLLLQRLLSLQEGFTYLNGQLLQCAVLIFGAMLLFFCAGWHFSFTQVNCRVPDIAGGCFSLWFPSTWVVPLWMMPGPREKRTVVCCPLTCLMMRTRNTCTGRVTRVLFPEEEQRQKAQPPNGSALLPAFSPTPSTGEDIPWHSFLSTQDTVPGLKIPTGPWPQKPPVDR